MTHQTSRSRSERSLTKDASGCASACLQAKFQIITLGCDCRIIAKFDFQQELSLLIRNNLPAMPKDGTKSSIATKMINCKRTIVIQRSNVNLYQSSNNVLRHLCGHDNLFLSPRPAGQNQGKVNARFVKSRFAAKRTARTLASAASLWKLSASVQ